MKSTTGNGTGSDDAQAKGKQDGFTLIETLVVIVILGILAAIAIPMYIGQRDKAKEATLAENSHGVYVSLHHHVAARPGHDLAGSRTR